FFSSRRRHTRSKRDWSSDVCSSDLQKLIFDLVLIMLVQWLIVVSDHQKSFFQMLKLVHLNLHSSFQQMILLEHLLMLATFHLLRSEERRVGNVSMYEGCTDDVMNTS